LTQINAGPLQPITEVLMEAILSNRPYDNPDKTIVDPGALWDVVIRASALCLLMLVVLAYFTGEETQHTHLILGYAVAALLLTSVYWELVRLHQHRFSGNVFSVEAVKTIFQSILGRSPASHAKPASSLAIIAIVLVLAVLAFCALLLMALTHTLWRASSVDEMHEVIAYFALGLVVFHVAIVIIASGENVSRRFQRVFGNRKHS
jgi:cytochrome b